jgi:hypothetical protein
MGQAADTFLGAPYSRERMRFAAVVVVVASLLGGTAGALLAGASLGVAFLIGVILLFVLGLWLVLWVLPHARRERESAT